MSTQTQSPHLILEAEEIRYKLQPHTVIGRDPDCTIVLKDPSVSRRHARISFSHSAWQIQDLESKHGTRVDGILLREPKSIAAGTLLQLGKVQAAVRVPEPEELDTEEWLEKIRVKLEDTSIDWQQIDSAETEKILSEAAREVGASDEDTHTKVLQAALGFGPIDALLSDPTISEIMVNGPNTIFVEKHGLLSISERKFESSGQLLRAVSKIAHFCKRKVDEQSPLLDARLPDGSRVHIALPPVALDGPTVTIRKFATHSLSPANLVQLGTISEQGLALLQDWVKQGKNLIVSGGTGSGKTTLLNVLSTFIPDTLRILTIEDSAELSLNQPHTVRLETRPARAEGAPEISIRDLVRNSLRMRPDRIVVGECRGAEALDMIQAMNTGHSGSLTTVHANHPRDAISRIETLCLFAGFEIPVLALRTQIVSAIDGIIQIKRFPDGSRRITHITEIVGMEGETPVLREHYQPESMVP